MDLALAASLIERDLGARPAAVSEIETMGSSAVFSVRLASGEEVFLKSDREDVVLFQAWIPGALASLDIPVPRVLASGEADGHHYLVMEAATGVPLEEFDPPDAHLVQEAGALARRLHSLPLEGAGWVAVDRNGAVRGMQHAYEDMLRDILEWSFGYIGEHRLLPDEVLRSAGRAMDGLVDRVAGRPTRFLHGDFRAAHVFVSPDRARVTALIDFQSTMADPVLELAKYATFESAETTAALLRGYADPEIDAVWDELAPGYRLFHLLTLVRWFHEHGADPALPIAETVRALDGDEPVWMPG